MGRSVVLYLSLTKSRLRYKQKYKINPLNKRFTVAFSLVFSGVRDDMGAFAGVRDTVTIGAGRYAAATTLNIYPDDFCAKRTRRLANLAKTIKNVKQFEVVLPDLALVEGTIPTLFNLQEELTCAFGVC